MRETHRRGTPMQEKSCGGREAGMAHWEHPGQGNSLLKYMSGQPFLAFLKPPS